MLEFNIKTEAEAQNVLRNFAHICERHGFVTLGDLYRLLGVDDIVHTDDRRGWDDPYCPRFDKLGELVYRLRLPTPKPFGKTGDGEKKAKKPKYEKKVVYAKDVKFGDCFRFHGEDCLVVYSRANKYKSQVIRFIADTNKYKGVQCLILDEHMHVKLVLVK